MEKKSIAAVILCAGKGTRMNDDSKNKVCFDCAGIPVIRRIIANMRLGGVDKFVIVVGHQAQTVMDCLSGEKGVVFAYQKEQRGTGHAARCGLEALAGLGFTGRSLIAMGDKIVAPSVIEKLVAKSDAAKAVWGVQPVEANRNGGRVVVRGGRPYGVVEWADVAYQSLAGHKPEKWGGVLSSLGLNAKKSAKVLERASRIAPAGKVNLCGRDFSATELRAVPYANAGLYCFDVAAALSALDNCRADNAQGEIYLTDTLEHFAAKGQAALLEIKRAEDMLTFSTKVELRDMSRFFLKNASEYLEEIKSGGWNERFAQIYGPAAKGQAERYASLVEFFMAHNGDRKVLVTRSPGRVNLMGRHTDHRGGCTNVMTIDRDTIMVVSPRDDDTVSISNLDPAFTPAEFSISQSLELGGDAPDWLSYLEAPAVMEALAATQGHWGNYVKAAVLRFQKAVDFPLSVMDIAATGNIPIGAGLSSSSAIVVATAEAVTGLNCLNLSERAFIDLCGEGEWFVGSRGGAGDHAAMKCGRQGAITQLLFKPFSVGITVPFSNDYAVIVADSLQTAKKSEGSKDTFNAKVATYEFAFMLLRKRYPQRGWREFRELAEVVPQADIYRMLEQLPEHATRKELTELLPTQGERLAKIFATHSDPGSYDLRSVTLYGISECARASMFGQLLEKGDYALLGEMMKISHDGDRIEKRSFTDDVLEKLAKSNAPVWRECGSYLCSTKRIDEMCDLLNGTEGVMGSSIVGAGLGGSVIAIAKAECVEAAIEALNKGYYDKYGLPHCANVYRPGAGSMTL